MEVACVVCKSSQSVCDPECIWRSLFPQERADEYELIDQVFDGQCVLDQRVRGLEEHERVAAIAGLLWEATTWIDDPVRGPYGAYLAANPPPEISNVAKLEMEVNALKVTTDRIEGLVKELKGKND